MKTSKPRREIPAALSPEFHSFLVVHQYGTLAVMSPTMIRWGMARSQDLTRTSPCERCSG